MACSPGSALRKTTLFFCPEGTNFPTKGVCVCACVWTRLTQFVHTFCSLKSSLNTSPARVLVGVPHRRVLMQRIVMRVMISWLLLPGEKNSALFGLRSIITSKSASASVHPGAPQQRLLSWSALANRDRFRQQWQPPKTHTHTHTPRLAHIISLRSLMCLLSPRRLLGGL